MLSPKAIGKSPSVLLLASRGSKHSLVHSCITAFCLHLLSSSLCIYVSSLLIRTSVIVGPTQIQYSLLVLIPLSIQFSRSVVSDSLRPHELQHARPPCPSPTPGVHSNSRPSSRWCHPAISSSVVPFSSCPQSLPASESFPVSQLFASGGQNIGVSALASVLPKNTRTDL